MQKVFAGGVYKKALTAVFLTFSEEKIEKNEKLLQKCYKCCKKVLKFVKNVLE